MALIKCKECGREISSIAENCPHCGYRTTHGRSVTQAKVLLVQLVIALAVVLLGAILFFGNISQLLELHDEWDGHWYYSKWSFPTYLREGGETGTLYKVIVGVALFVGGIVDLFIVKAKAKTIGENGFDMGRKEHEHSLKSRWKCEDCGEMNPEIAESCQYCGATKLNSKKHSIR